MLSGRVPWETQNIFRRIRKVIYNETQLHASWLNVNKVFFSGNDLCYSLCTEQFQSELVYLRLLQDVCARKAKQYLLPALNNGQFSRCTHFLIQVFALYYKTSDCIYSINIMNNGGLLLPFVPFSNNRHKNQLTLWCVVTACHFLEIF
jgi:hypothetical protein